MLEHVLVPVNRAGWPFIAGALIFSVLAALIWKPLVFPGLFIAGFCAWFFRDPLRQTPVRPGLVVSPADGVVSAIETAIPPVELGAGHEPQTRVSIFLSVFDVHVNRIPTEGRVTETAYHHGKFLNAALDKASEENERMSVKMETADHKEIIFVQIAGLIARRILNDLHVGQTVRTGERFGLIRFGSRVDLYLPQGTEPLVATGQRMVGGETVIADLCSEEKQRRAEAR